jgi:aspartyl-tRNA(Asn)/glutamyl-tRNA(Gln) amidotransferase subunit B
MTYIIEGNTGKWECVIGLEVHAQVNSNTKLFSGASTEFGASPNSQVSFVDAAMPGMLPVLNEYCVYQAIKTGLGINATINKYSVFDRKNYFYPDLPQGYQISQFYYPIVENGIVQITTEHGQKNIRVNRIHLEQDAGKSIHDQSPKYSFIDLNRSGIGLMEIVSEPDIRSPEEAVEYLKNLRMILRYLDSCDGDMEKGSLRCDVNVSVRKIGDHKLGTRCEIKNVNSLKSVIRAIEYESLRHVELIESGGVVDQETRLFDADSGVTKSMRTKEDSNDYRYFPDPDLLPLILSDALIEQIRNEMPEMPEIKKQRYIKDFNISEYDASVLCEDKDTAAYFEKAIPGVNPKLVANWITSELFGLLNKYSISLLNSKITPLHINKLVSLIDDGTISGKIAKIVFEEMFDSGAMPDAIVEAKGLVQMSDVDSIKSIISETLKENPDSVEAYHAGKEKLFGFFVGQVMKKTQGKANPSIVNDILLDMLKNG